MIEAVSRDLARRQALDYGFDDVDREFSHVVAQMTVDELRAHCRERLTAYKVPAAIAFRDTLPKTLVGKILRRSLRDS